VNAEAVTAEPIKSIPNTVTKIFDMTALLEIGMKRRPRREQHASEQRSRESLRFGELWGVRFSQPARVALSV
jgi:hypothetical protein